MAIDPDSTVDAIMRDRPESVGVFLDLRTGCVGCAFAQFCTLTEVSVFYDFPLDGLLARIDEATQPR